MGEKMEAVVKTRPELGGTEIKEVEIPSVGPNDVLIKVRVASICGTDVHIYNWDPWAQGRIKTPRIYGHEFCGEVVEVGPNVTSVKPGDYVSGECHIACGHCYLCKTGNAHICRDMKIFGVDVDGIFAEYACIPENNVWRNDPDLKPELASIQDPLGNAIHSVFAADVPGRNVAVLGCGPIGVMSVAVCKAIGAAQIFAVGRRNMYRINLAKKAGATKVFRAADDVEGVVREMTDGLGVDVVLEMSGNTKAVQQGLRLLRPGGTLVLLGVYTEPAEIDLSKDVVFKYVNIKGINGRLMFDTWYRMAGLLKSGSLDLDFVITHRYKFKDFEEAMQTMRSGNSGKVVLKLE
ncbi:MAG: L-threonine 3-dehydrogenase [Methanobacteriota archaeon]|nr:MAG: L-threonine 3-dehydrogenase [Euryarchaeota archaeon]